MFSSQPHPPFVTWTTTNSSNTIPANLMPTATVSVPHHYTPEDVSNYLGRMDFVRMHTSTGDMWQHKDHNGYMTWEQAVVYCLVKPWLVEEA